MKIAEGLEMLELPMIARGNEMIIHPVVVYGENSCVLVDTGMPNCYQAIVNSLDEAGIPAEGLHSVILTHQDIDHVGSLPHFLARARQPLDVYAHADDKRAIDGEVPLLKLPPEMSSAILQSLPPKERSEYEHAFSAETGPECQPCRDGWGSLAVRRWAARHPYARTYAGSYQPVSRSEPHADRG